MKKPKPVAANIDDYIAAFPLAVQDLLQSVRKAIRNAAPQATEKISYQIPTFALHGNLIHFAAFKNHIGLYPGPAAIDAFKQDLRDFHTSKGAIQFPLDKPIPLSMIERIVRFRVEMSSASPRKLTHRHSGELR